MDEFHARRLVDLYADTILRISYSYLKQTCDAEDICQTVFLKYLTNDCTFDSIDHEKAWIIRTTINACKDYLKSAHFRRTVALDEAEAVAAPPVPDTEVLDALKRLPEQYRISLYLFYYEEYSAKEIAQALKEQYKLDVDKKKISLNGEIKAFGTFSFDLKLHNGVVAAMKVMVRE